ncbi:MAG: GntR family transcriptional regulator [Thermoleophilia bacterium]
MTSDVPRAAKDRVYDHVKEGILLGDYPGGELLSEGEVAAELEVSRTPVREAFLLLEAEGLMRLFPKRGALVVPVSPDEVRDVMETRLMVETHAAARIAERGPEDDDLVIELRTLCDRQEEALARGDLAGFVEWDRALHHAIVARDGNAILTRLHDSLSDRQRRMTGATVRRDPGVTRRFLDEHLDIVDAIAAGKPEQARDLLAAHIEAAWRGMERDGDS